MTLLDRAGDAHAQALVQHLTRHLGQPSAVLAETDPTAQRIDVAVVPPTADRPWTTLVTVGMSATPMTVPEALADRARVELLLAVPADWPGLGGGEPDVDGALQRDAAYWPIRLLKALARYPHRSGAWLAPGHTLPSAAPFHVDVPWSTALVAPPIGLPAGVVDASTPAGAVTYLGVVPITDAEHALATASDDGPRALVERLVAAGVTVAIDVDRASVA